MKAIPEEKLREYIEYVGESGVVYAASLVNLLEEINTLTVSKLLPMRDAPRDGTDIQLLIKSGRFIYGANYGFGDKRWLIPGIGSFYDDDFLGWLPMPICDPENK